MAPPWQFARNTIAVVAHTQPTGRTEAIVSTTGNMTPRATDAESEALILARAGINSPLIPVSSFSPLLVYVAGMSARPTIEHDPNEPKIDRRPESFRLIFVLLAFAWFGTIYAYGVEWRSAIMGGATGMMFMLWASVRFKHLW
ncbi:hypothetical protein [Ensifer aridi]|uniref:hypothetical protein n=1 Tax=Ensifer aridi TaxID=1708715 RepID=UPI001FCCCEAF|nr:hypothetical protein [Ensifer aridi]